MTIQEQFDIFRQENPHVEERLVQLARAAKARGRKKLGIWLLFGVLRWEFVLTTNDPTSRFKLNNNYASRYARLLMDTHPDLAGFFETRELRVA